MNPPAWGLQEWLVLAVLGVVLVALFLGSLPPMPPRDTNDADWKRRDDRYHPPPFKPLEESMRIRGRRSLLPGDGGLLPPSMRGIMPEGSLAGFTFLPGGCRVCTGKLEGRPLFVLEPGFFGSRTHDFREMVETGIVPDCVDWAGQEGIGRAPHVMVELWHCRGCQTGRLDFRFMTPRTLLGDAEDESQRESYDLPPEVVQNLLKAGPAEG